VVRGSRQGESHGGVYLVDFTQDRAVQMIDWNAMNIDWQGRGWDRGLRGIAFDGETVYIAASDELFAYSSNFKLLGSWRNRYLKHCHEIFRHERTLFLSSTGFDSVLGFDLDRRSFSFGLHVASAGEGFTGTTYDPEFDRGPAPGNQLHLNNVHCERGGMYLSGLKTQGVLIYNGREVNRWAHLPVGTHNARPYRGGVLFNDTQAEAVRFVSRDTERAFPVPRYAPETLQNVDPEERVARQAFARGLCVVQDGLIACGSSPSTLSLHDLDGSRPSRQVTLTRDVRNAIHGLEVWPFEWRAPLRAA
jgi:hypothetical protein